MGGRMTGETHLAKLLCGMTPRLRDGVYVFSAVPAGKALSGDHCVKNYLPAIWKAALSFESEAEMRTQGVNRAFMLGIGIAVPLADNNDLEPKVVTAALRQHGRDQPVSLRVPEREEERHLPPNMGFQPNILLE